jgi:hypothetical protein
MFYLVTIFGRGVNVAGRGLTSVKFLDCVRARPRCCLAADKRCELAQPHGFFDHGERAYHKGTLEHVAIVMTIDSARPHNGGRPEDRNVIRRRIGVKQTSVP